MIETAKVKVVKVFAPISIGNISVGFDILGLAVSPLDGSLMGDIVEVKTASAEQTDNLLLIIGSHADRLPAKAEDNIVWQCLQEFNRELVTIGKEPTRVQMTLEKNIPTSSGLGSSACSVVAALVALNEFYDNVFDQQYLLKLMVELEAKISGSEHYDNVAPSYLGGLQLILDNATKIAQAIPIFEDCYWLMAYPDIVVSTKAARDILPQYYDRKTTIKFGQNIAGFIDACYRQDKQQAFECLTDVLAEPYRKALLPNFDEAKRVLSLMGCLSVGISGSGPTLFAVVDDLAIAEKVRQWLDENYLQTRQGFIKICKVDKQGARRIQ